MPRRPRLVLPGVPHHITQRGNNRQAVFFTGDDRELYLELLTHQAARHGVHILGYCLMTNHAHLVATPDRENSLARTLGQAHAEYAQALNQASRRSGHLWQNRFFSCALDESRLVSALQYVDLNPVRAGLAPLAWEWRWSSARAHSVEEVDDPVLDRDWGSRVGGWDYGAWRECLTYDLPAAERESLRRATLTGEPLGSQEFMTRLEREAGRRLRVLPRGRPRKQPEQGEMAG